VTTKISKAFHVSDVLTITTGRLVSRNGVSGLYKILNFLTGDNLFTHQLPRALDEVSVVLKPRFPELLPLHPRLAALIEGLSTRLKGVVDQEDAKMECEVWVEEVRREFKLPEYISFEHGEAKEHHRDIDALQELHDMQAQAKRKDPT
jgi:hypothetical protein